MHLCKFAVSKFKKMKRIFNVLLAVIGSGVMMISCDKDDDTDTTAPVINSATIDGKEEGIEANVGNAMIFEVKVSDNEALGQLKLDVHDAFDGHSHDKSSGINWANVAIIDLSGTEQTVSHDMEIPTNATAGPYHAEILVIDAEGNEGEFVERVIMIRNGSEPGIEITSPDFTNEVHVSKGSTLSLEGMVTDETDLAEILIILEEEEEDAHKSVQHEALYEMDFDLEGTSDLTWDFQLDGNVNIAIPATAEEGHYVLTVRAEDSEGNINIFEAELHIM